MLAIFDFFAVARLSRTKENGELMARIYGPGMNL